ncbi:MAG: gliding motility-associated C-terminal domain-containing protein, partial [Flavobacteriales bacterium]|nr:gliding motility-associated C-terminal domain-containing protein [Flavobacteriales bacterium]
SWSGPSPVAGGLFDPATMTAGVYTYTVAGIAPCPSESATVTVTINTPPDPGTDGVITLCSSDAEVSLFAQLGGTPDAGGSWSGPSAVAGGLFDPAMMTAGVYTYTVAGIAPCPSESATVTVTINTPPNPGTDGAITLCSSDAAVSLFAQLGGTPDAGGSWSGPSAVAGGLFDPATMNAGVYTYTVAGIAPCPSESATVTVTINTPPNPGTDGAITLCSSDAAVSLFAQLGGTPDAGGSWSGPSAVAGGSFDPAAMNAGVYTYTVAGLAPCPSESATVAVTINTPPNPGTDGAIALCATSPPASLFAALGGSPAAGGTWSGPSALNGNLFDATTMAPGTYTYTVVGLSPCPSASAEVVVNVVTNPDAGTPGSVALCTSASAIDLFAQIGGTPDAGGTWSGPSAISNGSFDPATMSAGVYTYTITVPPPCTSVSTTVMVDLVQPPDAGTDGALTLCISSPSTPLLPSIGGTPDAGGTWSGPSVLLGGAFNPANMTPGTYTYTVAGTPPCPAASSDVVVNVVTTPDAGLPGNITVCASGAAFNLFDELNGTPDVGGVWSGPSAVLGGQFDPATMAPGVYTYTISVPAPCVNVSSTVTVSVVQPPDAGTDGALTLCISSPSTPLLPSIGGTPDAGGTWSGPSVLTAGSFNPATMVAGNYIYTVAGTAPCPAEMVTVQVDVVDAPNAGTPGSIALCATDDAIDLFAQLGGAPDAGGTWNGPSVVSGGSFDPSSMLPGVYTYTITVPPPCTNASSTVTVSVVQPPDAGLDGGLTLCATSGPEALINGLGGAPDAGGTWSGPSVVSGGTFNPATMTVGAYTYTVAGIAPCPAASAVVEMNVVDNPDPGAPGFITLCSTDAAVDMFTWIEGSPDAGGTWSGPSAVSGGLFDPAVNTPGIYTYTLTVPPPCTSASTTVTVNVVLPPDAGLDATTTLCVTSGSTPLFPVLQGTPDAGGTWARPNGTAFDGIIAPATDASGDYLYTVAGTFPCPADMATVTVNIVNDQDPGTDGTLTLCASDAASPLFAALGGTPDGGGVWTDPSGNVFSGTIDPSVHTSGIYTYTIAAPPPCSNVSSTVTVSIIAPPNAGSDGAITLCATGDAIDLFSVLQGAPQPGGTWTHAGTVVGVLFDPSSAPAGVYTYTVPGTIPCPSDAASVTVAITDEPNAGEDAILNLCITGDMVTLFPSLGGADPGGTWTGPDGTSDGTFTPGTSTPGAYVYAVNGTAPCPNASATVTVVQLSDPDAGNDGAATLCSSNAPVGLFSLLQGTPDAGGIWLNSANAIVDEDFDPALGSSGTFRYILSVPPPCISDTALVLIEVVPASDAGEDATVASCANGAAIDLFNALNGTPDTGGTWSGPGGSADGTFQPGSDTPGDYTYSITALAPCPNVAATVTVGVETPPNAGLDGNATLCPEAPSIMLFDLLGGSPDATGTWTGPGGVTSDGSFDPATDAPGTYTYTVFGELCPEDAASASVNIYVVPTPNAGPDAISCNLKYDLMATGTWASGTWIVPPGFLIDDATSPTALVSAPSGGSYSFVWNVVTPEGCAASDTVNVLFTDVMQGVTTTSDAICNGSCDGAASVNATGGNGEYMYIWSGGVAGDEAEAIGLCAGMYNVIVADTNGCNVVIPYVIGEPELLTIDGVVTAPETCPGTCDGTLVVNDADGVSFTVNGVTQASPLFNGLCPGTYLVVMTDANGCIAQSAGVVASPPPVIPSFTYSPDTIVVTNAEVNFLNLSSSNAVSFAWTFGEEDESTAENPTYTFPGVLGAIYNVCLTAYDANGCSNTACLPIPIYDVLAVHVPNAFTPNGDGINDEFLPIFNVPQVKDYEFLVFNRWGEQIFGTNLPGKPWDGRYGGVVSQVDVYVWKLICKDAITGDLIERIGHVTIVE